MGIEKMDTGIVVLRFSVDRKEEDHETINFMLYKITIGIG